MSDPSLGKCNMAMVVTVVTGLLLLVAALPATATGPAPSAVRDDMDGPPGIADGGDATRTDPARYADAAARWVELLAEAVPRARRVAILVVQDASDPDAAAWAALAATSAHAARRRALHPEVLTSRHRGELLDAFVMMRQAGVEAVIALPTPLAVARAADVATQAARHALPLVGGHRRFIDAGALLSYGLRARRAPPLAADHPEPTGSRATRADRPAGGSHAGFELVVNARVAGALGLAIAPSLRRRADQLIE